MKAIILARVSDKKQDSNEAQILRVFDYVKNKQLTVWKTYEIEESSTKGDREKFQKVVEEIREAKEPIALVVDTVDRLQRSFKESVQLDDLRKAGKLEIHFYRESLVINQNSNSSDLLRWDMAVMFARSYVLQLSDNVKRKQEQMLRSGIYPSQPPYGYKRVPIAKDKTEIVIDEYASKIVQKAYEWYATSSFSMELLREKLKKEYGINWSKGFTDKVLKDDFYYGLMTWNKGKPNEKIYLHNYPHIIEKSLFDQVQKIKAGFNKKPFKYAGKPYSFRGLLRCGHCGLAVTAEKHKGHVYYHCTQYNGKHNAGWVREEAITEEIGQVFKRLKLPEHVLNEIVSNLKTIHEGKMEFHNKHLDELTQERKTYTDRCDKLYLDHLDGRITNDDYDRYYQSFRDRISEIDTKLAMLQTAEDDYYLTSKYLLELSNRAYELFVSSEVEEKRQLIKLVLSNLRVEGKSVRYEAQKPFNTILNYADNQLWLPRRDSNPEPCRYSNPSVAKRTGLSHIRKYSDPGI